MKLRIRDNSVRIRLTRSEVERLGHGDRIEQATEFTPVSRLISAIEISKTIKSPQASFSAGEIKVMVPEQTVADWWQSESVSIEATQTISPGKELQILIEKDFQCLHCTTEESADAYPNPRAEVSHS